MTKIKNNVMYIMLVTATLLAIYCVADDNNNNQLSTNAHIPEKESLLSDDDFFFDDDNDPFIDELSDTTSSRTVDPDDIINLLLEIDAIAILQTDFFLRTNPLNRRSPLDEPIFEPDRCYFNSWVIGIHPFARKTDRSNFTFRSTCISSYLALGEPSLIGRLQNTINLIQDLLNNPQLNIDIDKIFSLFSNTTVEERRGAFMFHMMRQWPRMTFRLFFPFYYLERNFFLTDAEKDAIAEEFGIMDQDDFAKNHFISDKLGIGDTRIELDFDLVEKESFLIKVGTQATIPTAFTWGRAFKGSAFPKPSTFPIFDFNTLFCLAEDPSQSNAKIAFDLLSNFFLKALDRISANLLDTKLGNGGHLGLGLFLRSKVPLKLLIKRLWTKNLTYTNRLSVEYLFPATKKRFFINKINEKEFEERDFSNADQATENLTFLEEKFIERVYLRAFDVRIQPGVILRWTSKLCHQGKRWGFNIGTDFWLQDKEKIRSIDAPRKTLMQIDRSKVKPPVAYQGKIFGSLVLKIERSQRTWFITLNSDSTVSNKGLGEDYALSLNIETTF